VPPSAAAVRRGALQSKSLREFGNERTCRCRAQVLVRRARDEQIEVRFVALADGSGENPAFELHLNPIVPRYTAGQDGAARQASNATASDVLIKPCIIGSDAVTTGSLGVGPGNHKAKNS
jgi:hypothetical protein